jgi:carbonic anhydrase
MAEGASLDRRSVLLGGAVVGLAALAGCGVGPPAPPAPVETGAEAAGAGAALTLTASAALQRLRSGNGRFVTGRATHPQQSTGRRTEVAAGQHPFAQVLACADSRVAPELVFDQGLGDLFVTRSAGQVVDHALLGTIQFGAHEFGIPLLVVLGHSACGAVKATIEAIEHHSGASGTDVDTLVGAIRPSVEAAAARNPADLLAASVAQNVRDVVDRLTAAAVLAPAVAAGRLQVIGAVYDLPTGKVTFT